MLCVMEWPFGKQDLLVTGGWCVQLFSGFLATSLF